MKRLTFLILFTTVVFSLFAQKTDLCRKSTEGTDFWFGFMESRNAHSKHYVEITITARETTTFTIGIGPNETPFGGTYTVNANSSLQVEIPWQMVEPVGSENIEDFGIHLVSEKPINVYALNWDTNSADVAVIYPLESLGKEHFAMCYFPDIDVNNPVTGNGKNSEFLVVAAFDSTHVEITPSKVTDQNRPKDSTFVVILNKGQVFQVQSENLVGSSARGQGDLTGSYVKSDKPVAFYSGSLSTRVPVGQCCWDHLYEQIPPIQSWGREYYVVPLQTREYDRYRIMAAQDSTTVQINGLPDFYLNRGEFKELVFRYDDPKRIFADKPIMVAQFSQSRNVDRDFTGGNGDPFMIILSSITQSKNDVTFVAYNSDQIKKYFVNIVTLTSEIPNMRYKGQPISGFKPFPVGDYSYVQKEIGIGTHRIENLNKDRGFLAYVYGYGGVESYGYGVGFNLDLVLDLGESINFNGDTLLLCYGETRVLDAGPYFDTFSWNTGDTTQTLKVTEGGKYYVKTTTVDGCELEDSIFIFMPHPKVDLGVEYDDGCTPHSIDLDASSAFKKYVWNNEKGETLSTNQIYTADQTGEYRVTVYDQYNCVARDTMNLVVFAVPKIELSSNELVCGAKTAHINAAISEAPENEWNYPGSFKWWSNNTDLVFSDSTQTGTNIEVSDWGEYEIYYELKTINGCISNDTFRIVFHPQPNSSFVFEDDSKCEGYSKKLIFTGTATDSAAFFWELDGCQFVDTLGWQKYNVSVGAFLAKPPFIELVINDNGCWSDTTIHPLGARPNFKMDADKRRGCDQLTVNFNSELLTQDNVVYEWRFHDGTIVNSPNATFNYTSPGFYDVALTITNPVTQCTNGFTLDSMIKVFPTPTAAITADPSFCYPDSAFIFYTNTIDSSICSWEFSEAHQSGGGNDSIWVTIDEPFGTIQLTVDEYGCVSEPVQTILKRKPHFDFYTENEEGCQPYLPEIVAEPFDSTLDFQWMLDSLPYPAGNSYQYLFPDSGRFNVGLIGHSQETGCFDTLQKQDWIWVHPKPFSKFEVDFPVALLEHSEITFTNYSRNANLFSWDFDDGETSLEEAPKHTFKELGEFNTQLVVESGYGCLDTSEFVIKILPFSVFTPNAFRPDSEIAENRTFMPVGTGADLSRFRLRIYDRWGQLIFETRTPETPWDGTAKNGQPAPMGNYVWISHYFDIQGYEHNQKGQVLLVR